MKLILVVVLALPRTVAGLLVRATAIVDAIEANSKTFPTPVPKVAVVRTHIASLSSTEAATKTRTSGSVDARNADRAILIGDLQQLRAYVQQKVSANPTEADVIATAALMSLRKPRSHDKRDLVVKQLVSRSVRVVTKAIKGAGAYDWQISPDGKTWTSLPPTVQASTTVENLEPATTYRFRVRAITRAGAQPWSVVVTWVVQ